MHLRLRLTLVSVVSACALLLAPAGAFADQSITVNNTGDAGDFAAGLPCETANGNGVCTLRAALEVADTLVDPNIAIGFSIPEDSTIAPATRLNVPMNTSVYGCDAPVDKPCINVIGDVAGSVIRLRESGARIAGLAVGNLDGPSSAVWIDGPDTYLYDSWIGMSTTGVAVPSETGVYVSTGATSA